MSDAANGQECLWEIIKASLQSSVGRQEKKKNPHLLYGLQLMFGLPASEYQADPSMNYITLFVRVIQPSAVLN